MTKIYNRTEERDKRKHLRSNMTEAEIFLWEHLRKRKVGGQRFRRQASIGPYIVDFYCPKLRIAIEADGNVHDSDGAREYDAYRRQYIESIGIVMLRFSNDQILSSIKSVLEKIEECININLPLTKGEVAEGRSG